MTDIVIDTSTLINLSRLPPASAAYILDQISASGHVVLTDVVVREAVQDLTFQSDQIISEWIARNGITVTPRQVAADIDAGIDTGSNPGDRSIDEVVRNYQAAGEPVIVAGDDGWFNKYSDPATGLRPQRTHWCAHGLAIQLSRPITGFASQLAGLWVVRASISAPQNPGAPTHVEHCRRDLAEVEARREQATSWRRAEDIVA